MLPVLSAVFLRRKRPFGSSWRMDETYIKVSGQWKYLSRAVDRAGGIHAMASGYGSNGSTRLLAGRHQLCFELARVGPVGTMGCVHTILRNTRLQFKVGSPGAYIR